MRENSAGWSIRAINRGVGEGLVGERNHNTTSWQQLFILSVVSFTLQHQYIFVAYVRRVFLSQYLTMSETLTKRHLFKSDFKVLRLDRNVFLLQEGYQCTLLGRDKLWEDRGAITQTNNISRLFYSPPFPLIASVRRDAFLGTKGQFICFLEDHHHS